MKWEDERQSDNVDDLRGDNQGGGGFGGGGGGGGLIGLLFSILPMLGLRGGIGVIVVIAIVVFALPMLGNLGGGGQAGPQTAPSQRSASGFQPESSSGAPRAASPAGDENLRFVRAVAAYTEDTWTGLFAQEGKTYSRPRIELYTRGHQTGCGFGQAAMGPFYCPQDRKVWLDLAFFDELSGRFGAPGRFAEAYVIAHEIGHHVQTLLGTTQKVDAQRRSLGRGTEGNRLSVRVELQADCYAGVWTKATNDRAQASGKVFLEDGDIAGGLKAATAVGDDTLQQESQGRVAPDSFTHGTSAQRVRWFRQGFSTGQIAACDTFSPDYGSL